MPKLGEVIPLSVQLFDGDETKFVRAILEDASGTPLGASPVTLTHITSGRYDDSSVFMPNTSFVSVTYETYNDAGFTSLSAVHSFAIDTFVLDVPFADIQARLGEIKDLIEALAAAGVSVIGQTDLTATILDETVISAVINDIVGIGAEIKDDDDISSTISDDTLTAVIKDGEDIEAAIECD